MSRLPELLLLCVWILQHKLMEAKHASLKTSLKRKFENMETCENIVLENRRKGDGLEIAEKCEKNETHAFLEVPLS